MKAYLDDDCFRSQEGDPEVCPHCGQDMDGEDETILSDVGVEAVQRLELLTLTGNEREDVESALAGEDCDPERLRIIWQNHLSELLEVAA